MHFHCQGSLGCSCLVPVLTPANFLMASPLKIVGNEAKCFCSVHQGANVARGTLERVVHPYPLRHAHTWPRAPCHCIWLLCRIFVLVQSQPTNVHTFLAKRERGGPHPVLDSAECYHHSGWVCVAIIMGSANRHRPTRTEHFFLFVLQMGSVSRANPRNNASGCIVCFHTIPCRPLPRGVSPC